MRKTFIAFFCLVATTSLAVQKVFHQPIGVCVLGRAGIQAPPKRERNAHERELKKNKKESERARKDVEKQLKKKYGKRWEKWPEDAQILYKHAQEVEAAARHQLDYLDCTQKDVDDFVDVLKDACAGTAHYAFYGDDVSSLDRYRKELESLQVVQLVDYQDEADLIIEIQALRPAKGKFVRVKIIPVDHIDPMRISDIDISGVRRGMRGRGVNKIHNYDQSEPYWVFDLINGGPNKGVTGLAIETAAAIAEFVKENHAALAGL